MLAEFRFFLERTISGVDLLDMALKDDIVALYPYHSHLPGFRRLTIMCVQLWREGFESRRRKMRWIKDKRKKKTKERKGKN